MGEKEGRIETIYYCDQLYLILYSINLNTLTHYSGRIAGIEPASSPWQREILPFDYIRILFFVPDPKCIDYIGAELGQILSFIFIFYVIYSIYNYI